MLGVINFTIVSVGGIIELFQRRAQCCTKIMALP